MLTKQPTVNDGGGLWDNEGVCDSGILLCNAALKDLIDGQYLLFVNKLEQVAQIFANLKKGIKDDRESLENKIEDLKRQNALIAQQATAQPVDKEGV